MFADQQLQTIRSHLAYICHTDNITKSLEKCIVGIGKAIRECIGKELDCGRDDHWLHLVADQISALIRVRNQQCNSGTRLKAGRQWKFGPRKMWS